MDNNHKLHIKYLLQQLFQKCNLYLNLEKCIIGCCIKHGMPKQCLKEMDQTKSVSNHNQTHKIIKNVQSKKCFQYKTIKNECNSNCIKNSYNKKDLTDNLVYNFGNIGEGI